jgi:hypothetical protein
MLKKKLTKIYLFFDQIPNYERIKIKIKNTNMKEIEAQRYIQK